MDARVGTMLIFAFVFLGAFVALLGLVPSGFTLTTKDYSEAYIPDTWNGIDLLAYNFTGVSAITLNNTNQIYDFSIGGRNLRLQTKNVFGALTVYLFHRYGFGLWWNEAMLWYNKNGFLKSFNDAGGAAYLPSDALDEDFIDNDSIQFTVVCLGLGSGSSYFKVTSLFSFNTTTYATPTDAWNADALQVLFGITLSDSNTAMNAWYILTSLLTFNTLELFGTASPEAVALNFLLALPFFAAIGFIATAIILEVLPF